MELATVLLSASVPALPLLLCVRLICCAAGKRQRHKRRQRGSHDPFSYVHKLKSLPWAAPQQAAPRRISPPLSPCTSARARDTCLSRRQHRRTQGILPRALSARSASSSFSKAAGIPAKPASAPNTASVHIITRQVNSRCVSLRYSVRYIPALSATSPPASTAALTDAGFVSRIFIEVRLFSSSFISSASSSCFESLSASLSSLPFSLFKALPVLVEFAHVVPEVCKLRLELRFAFL